MQLPLGCIHRKGHCGTHITLIWCNLSVINCQKAIRKLTDMITVIFFSADHLYVTDLFGFYITLTSTS